MAAVVVVGGAGCGAQEKKEQAERIVESVERMERIRTANAELRQSLTFERVRAEVGSTALKEGATTPEAVSALRVDFARRRVAATTAGTREQPPVAVQIFSDTRVFQRQPADAAASGRQWTTLDLDRLYDDRERDAANSAGSNLLNPAYLVDLLGGALTGSIEEAGTEDLRGDRVTRYRFNVSPETAFEDAPDDRREAVQSVLTLMGAHGEEVVPMEAWLDAEGRPRRVSLSLRQKRDRHTTFRMNVALDLFDFGASFDIQLPEREATASVASVSGLGPSAAGVLLTGNVLGPGGLPVAPSGADAPTGTGGPSGSPTSAPGGQP